MPLLTSAAKSPHEAIIGQQVEKLATVRDARWKLHILPGSDRMGSLYKAGQPWIDPRSPDGVTILAPHEQYQPGDHPGLRTGEVSKPMQLFDLQNDPGEQLDMAAQHPEIVERLRLLLEKLSAR